MRLIDADGIDYKYAEIRAGNGFEPQEYISDKDAFYFLNLAIDAMPTVKAIPVVRCKDCRWWDIGREFICANEKGLLEPDFDCFCSYGERKDGAE